MKILVAPNSFKESLSSVQIARIISEELSKEKYFQIITLPISDGGDGFLEVIRFINEKDVTQLFVETEFAEIKFECEVIIRKSTKELFIESAEVIGLKRIPKEYRKPLQINTFPLGKLIDDLIKLKSVGSIPAFEKIVVGVGGTSTIDLGLGAANALGVKFLDKNGNEIEPLPKNFSLISDIDLSHSIIRPINDSFLSCIVDVKTPLLGENSAIDLYGPQKCANKEELDLIKEGFENIIDLMIKKNLILDSSYINGAGGGLASGLKIFFDAEIISANDFIVEKIFRERNLSEEVNYLITGEGKFDIQSFEGKATGELIKKFSDKVKMIFLVCGKVDNDVKEYLTDNVYCFQLLDLYSAEAESKQKTEEGLKIISQQIKALILK